MYANMHEGKCCENILRETPFSSPIYGHLIVQDPIFRREKKKITFQEAIGSDGETTVDAMEPGKQKQKLVKKNGS